MSVLAPSRRAFGLFAVAILASGIAAADTIEYTTNGTGDGTGASPAEALWIDYDGTDTDLWFAGNLNITLTDSQGSFTRITMCVQISVGIVEGQTYDTTVYQPAAFSPPTGPELEQIAWLLSTYDPETNPLTNANAAAGLQFAIWWISTNGLYAGQSNPFASGPVQAIFTGSDKTIPAVVTDAENYLTDAINQSSPSAYVYYNYEANGTLVQMLEGPLYTTGPQGITPESSTFVLAGVALLALGRPARRKLGSR